MDSSDNMKIEVRDSSKMNIPSAAPKGMRFNEIITKGI